VLGPVSTGTGGTSPLELPDQLGDQIGGQADQLVGDEFDQLDLGEPAAGTGGQSGESGSASNNGGQSCQEESALGNGSPREGQDAGNSSGDDQQFGENQQLAGEAAGQGSEASKEKSDKEGNGKIDPSLRLINTAPISVDQSIDEPVTSGGDVVVGDAPNPSN